MKSALRAKFSNRNDRMYRKVFGVTLLCIVFIVLLMSLLTYFLFKDMSLERSRNQTLSSFLQIEKSTQRMTETATAMALQVQMDNNCSTFLTATKPITMKQQNNIVRQLRFYRDINAHIQSIYLYNSMLDTVYTSASTQRLSVTDFAGPDWDGEMVDILNHFGGYSFLEPIERTVAVPLSQINEESRVLTYVLSETGKQEKLPCAVVINISQDWLYSLVETLPDAAESAILALSDKGDVTINYKKDNLFRWQDAEVLLTDFDTIGSISREITQDGERYLVTGFCSSENGWRYFKAEKWDNVFAGIVQIRNITLLVLALVLLLALVAALLLTGRFHKSYSAVVASYRRLQSQHLGDSARLRASLLHDLLTGSVQNRQRELEEKMEKCEFTFSLMDQVTLLVLRIDSYNAWQEKFEPDASYDMKYGIANIFSELCAPHFPCQWMIEPGDRLIFLAPECPLDWGSLLETIFAEFHVRVQDFIVWEFSLLYTCQSTPLGEASLLYTSMERGARSLFFCENHVVFDTELLESRHHAPLVYPTALEQKLIQALRSGNVEESKQLYASFVAEIYSCSYDVFITGMILLCFAVTRLFDLYADFGDDRNPRYSSYTAILNKISGAAKLEEVDALFLQMLEDLCLRIESLNNRSGIADRLEEMRRYIESHYSDSELSLESISEVFSLSPSYVGRSFRKIYGISLTEFIGEVRIKEIGALLISTELSAKDIALRCGMLNINYFYTYFKKYFGLSPQAYRSKNPEKPGE